MANPNSSHLYQNFLIWLIIVGGVVFFIFVLNDVGVVAFVFATDSTRISQIIFLLFISCSIFIGYRHWLIAQEYLTTYLIMQRKENTENEIFDLDDMYRLLDSQHSNTSRYLSRIIRTKIEKDIAQLGELYAESLCGPHKIAWFISNILIKLGLLGTVIGFVIMLGTVSDLEQLNISGVKQLMQQMTQGMGVAMFTTMAGLLGSMLLSLQCLMLERSTDKLILMVVNLGQTIYSQQRDFQERTARIQTGDL